MQGYAYGGGDSQRFMRVVNVPRALQARHTGQLSSIMIG